MEKKRVYLSGRMSGVHPLLGIVVCGLLVSCTTTKLVEVERVRQDTVWASHTSRDSIYMHDSVYVREWTAGDTVYLYRDRWHTSWRDRWRHDTVYISHIDSIPVPYAVEKLVEKPLTWWEQTRLHVGGLLIFLLIIWLGWRFLLPLLRKRFFY